MKNINSKVFNFSFFLSNKVKVNNLEQAAKEHGGATHNLDTDEKYSNVEGNEFIKVYQNEMNVNTISLFIPDTVNVNGQASKEQIKKVFSYVVQKIFKKYQTEPRFENALGTWYSDELQTVVYDNIILVNTFLEDVTEADINFFVSLAKYIKKEMRQEAVSLNINSALALI